MRRGWVAIPAVILLIGLACGQPTSESFPSAPSTLTGGSPAASHVPTSQPQAPSGAPYATGEWPFVPEPPSGSAITPMEAATAIYQAMLRIDQAALLSFREDLDAELGMLYDLRQAGDLTDEQERQRRIAVYRYDWLDDFMVQVEMESEPSTAAGRVLLYLRAGVWTVDYTGNGLWRIETGTGTWEFDEGQQAARRIVGSQ